MNEFINIDFSSKNLDRYFIRNSIFKAIEEVSKDFHGNLLDIGCGKMPYKKYILEKSKVENYIGLDLESALVYDLKIQPDCTWDGVNMPFEENSFDCAFGTEVLEHCPQPDVVLKEVVRVLKPGGIFFFTVPFLWNLHEVPHDEYRYTPFSLERHLRNSGFSYTDIQATGGWHASMAQMLGLWVRRSPIKEVNKRILSFLLKPIIKSLIKKDKPKSVQFVEGQMITGLYGIAKK